MEALYREYKDKVQFFLVYTREIHPSGPARPAGKSAGKPGEKQDRKPPRQRNIPIAQHKNMQDRVIAASKCLQGLKLTLPVLLDTMDNTYTKTYSGMPAGTCVIDINGRIAYWNHGAPTGARPPQAEAAIRKLLAAGGAARPKEWAKVRRPRPDPGQPPAAEAPAKAEPPSHRTPPAGQPAEPATK